jgi:hypothetical protein
MHMRAQQLEQELKCAKEEVDARKKRLEDELEAERHKG